MVVMVFSVDDGYGCFCDDGGCGVFMVVIVTYSARLITLLW